MSAPACKHETRREREHHAPASVMTVGKTLWYSKLYKGVVARRLLVALKKEEPLEDLLLRPEDVLDKAAPVKASAGSGPFSLVGELCTEWCWPLLLPLPRMDSLCKMLVVAWAT